MKETSLELIENEIKLNCDLINHFKLHENYFNYFDDNVYSFYKLNSENDFDYALFRLYCFFNYDIDDIYKLIINIGKKYPKSNLEHLSYSYFIKYTKLHQFEFRKKEFERKTSAEYQNKIQLKEAAESEHINHLLKNYNDINIIIENLSDEIKFIENNEDITSEKKAEHVNKCSKTIIRLIDKRDNLFEKITEVEL